MHAEASSTHVKEWKCGHALFHEGLPLVYDLNYLRVGAGCEMTAQAVADKAEDLMGAPAFDHRKVVVDHEALAERWSPDFVDLGWKVDRHVVMVHRRDPDRSIDTSEVREMDESQAWPSRERFLRTYEWCNDDDIVAQMHAAYRIWMRAGSGTDLGIVRDGEAASFAMLWRHGKVAQIEDVATLEEHRNQGLSRAVVWRAVETAYEGGADLVFLIADVDDWPKGLYEKLGFDELAITHHFLKTNS